VTWPLSLCGGLVPTPLAAAETARPLVDESATERARPRAADALNVKLMGMPSTKAQHDFALDVRGFARPMPRSLTSIAPARILRRLRPGYRPGASQQNSN